MTIEQMEYDLSELEKRVSALEAARSLPDNVHRAGIGVKRLDSMSKLRELTENVIEILNDYDEHDGNVPITHLCVKHGIEYSRFLRFCDRASYLYDVGCEDLRQIQPADYASAIDLLYAKVFETGVDEAVSMLPADADGAVDAAFSMLTEREQKVMRMRLDKVTLLNIGVELGITRERVRQIESVAIRKLRKKPFCDVLRYGSEAVDEAKRMIREEQEKTAIEASRDMNVIEKRVLELPIEALNLTARPYNCLRRRTDVRTVGQLIEWSRAELMGLRDLGTKSLEEIVAALNQIGIRLKED